MGQISPGRAETLKLINENAYRTFIASFPLTRDSLNIYPDSLSIKGAVVDYTLGVNCGYFCGCGTLKIKLEPIISGYPFIYVFVAVPCFYRMTDEIASKREWSLYELSMNDRRCYWMELPMNKFPSFGAPFYIMEQDRIKQ